jgi:hypothetical protein
MFLYTICDPSTSEVRYVGITVLKRPGDRFRQHIHQANKGTKTHLYNWIRSLDGDPEFKIVAKADSHEELKEMEVSMIGEMRSKGIKLTNQTSGGDGTTGYPRAGNLRTPLSKETKDKIAAKLLGQCQGEKNPFYGKKHTEETKRIMSEKRRARKTTDETREKMSQAHLRRSTIKQLQKREYL